MTEAGLSHGEVPYFPPIEDELSGKSIEQLEQTFTRYEEKAEELSSEGNLWVVRWLAPDTYHYIQMLRQRAQAIRFYTDILKTTQILQNPDATPEEREFAAFTGWNVKIMKLAAGQVGNDSVDLTAHEFVSTFEGAQKATENRVRHILQENPMPKGQIARWEHRIPYEPFDI